MDRARVRRQIVWENFKWTGVFIKNDKWAARLKVPVHSGKTEKWCKLQERGVKCAEAAELLVLPGHKLHLSSPFLCRYCANCGHSWVQELWPLSLLSQLPPGEEDASAGYRHFPQVSSINTTVVVGAPVLSLPVAPPGYGRSPWLVVLYSHCLPGCQILQGQTLETPRFQVCPVQFLHLQRDLFLFPVPLPPLQEISCITTALKERVQLQLEPSPAPLLLLLWGIGAKPKPAPKWGGQQGSLCFDVVKFQLNVTLQTQSHSQA